MPDLTCPIFFMVRTALGSSPSFALPHSSAKFRRGGAPGFRTYRFGSPPRCHDKARERDRSRAGNYPDFRPGMPKKYVPPGAPNPCCTLPPDITLNPLAPRTCPGVSPRALLPRNRLLDRCRNLNHGSSVTLERETKISHFNIVRVARGLVIRRASASRRSAVGPAVCG